jgi:putative FmdB family regulatory protein
MPFYDLRCNKCEKEFNIRASMADKAENRIPCPECSTTDMVTVYKSAPAFIKSSGDSVQSCPGSASCGDTGCRFAG